MFQLVLALYITQALTKSKAKKHKASASEEGSIENLLYYKDCQRNAKPKPVNTAMPMRYELPTTTTPPRRQPECPFPKMCCALSCGNECGGSQPPTSHMQPEAPFIAPSNAADNIRKDRMGPVQPQPFLRRKKRLRSPPNNIPPGFPTRRDFSVFTKEKIKGLIAKDDDIRKILKDLVRVTMQKVDLQDMINANGYRYNDFNTLTSTTVGETYVDDYVE